MANFTDDIDTVTYARRQWEEGEDRLARFTPDSHRREVFEEIIAAVLVELERRVGQSFDTLQLVGAYREAEHWCPDIAYRVAPEEPWAWDMSIVLDASFHRFARQARDWGLVEAP